VASTGSGAQVQPCPSGIWPFETAALEPFGKVHCPACGNQRLVERVFESFAVVEPLGVEGMGSVYRAGDARLNRFVALKPLRKEFAGDATFTAKLKDEARITASIKHPHVIEVFSVGEDHGQFYVVMELVDGGSLDDRMEDEKRISEFQPLEVGDAALGTGGFRAVVDGVAALHAGQAEGRRGEIGFSRPVQRPFSRGKKVAGAWIAP
jgi:hypothetical protein